MSDEPTTKRPCLACGTHYELPDGSVCRWCTNGFQDKAQRAVWLAHKSGPRPAMPTPDKTASGAFNPHRAVMMGRLAKAWDKRPDLSFVELVHHALDDHHIPIEMLPFIDDKRLVELVERFVLLKSE